MKVAIITPSPDLLHARFAGCLLNMAVHSAMQGVGLAYFNPRFSTVGMARWHAVAQALDVGCDKVLFIDSDQTFPADGLLRLLSHKKKIVGGVSTTRVEPIEHTARDSKGKRINFHQRKGLHEVASNGFAFNLIDSEVFNAIEGKWFGPGDNCWYGNEDERFCKQAALAGFKVWVDADLQIGHLGVKEYL